MSRYDFFNGGLQPNKSGRKRWAILGLTLVALILQIVIEFGLFTGSGTPNPLSALSKGGVPNSDATGSANGSSEQLASAGQPAAGNVTPVPGKAQGVPGKVTPTPGKVQGIPGKVQGIPGKVQGVPGKVTPTPGKVQGVPGKVQGIPGKMPGIPGKMPGVPGKIDPMPGQTANPQMHCSSESFLLGLIALDNPQCKCRLSSSQKAKLVTMLTELNSGYKDVRGSTKVLHETLTPEQFAWLESHPDKERPQSNAPPEQSAIEPAMVLSKLLAK